MFSLVPLIRHPWPSWTYGTVRTYFRSSYQTFLSSASRLFLFLPLSPLLLPDKRVRRNHHHHQFSRLMCNRNYPVSVTSDVLRSRIVSAPYKVAIYIKAHLHRGFLVRDSSLWLKNSDCLFVNWDSGAMGDRNFPITVMSRTFKENSHFLSNIFFFLECTETYGKKKYFFALIKSTGI